MPKLVHIAKGPAFFLCVFTTVSPLVFAQQSGLTFETIAIEHEIATGVTCILQDRIGYMWFGTNNGLHKYDGYSFVWYKHKIDDTSSIADNRVFTLYEDKAGVMWVGTEIGLEKFDRTTNTFIHYSPNSSAARERSENFVLSIGEDRSGTLWVGTVGGLYAFDRVTGRFSPLPFDSTDPGSISHNSTNAIYENREGSLWFGTGGGLDRLDLQTGKFIHHWSAPGNRSEHWENSLTPWIQSLCEDEAGVLWLGTNGGLVRFDPKEGTSSLYRFDPKNPQNRINSICYDPVSGSLWIATWKSLYAFDRSTRTFTHYDQEANQVYRDRSGALWIGTLTDVKKLNRTKPLFKKYPSKNAICAVWDGTDGILWMWTFSGIKKFDIRQEQFVPYSFGKGNELFYLYPGPELIIKTEKGGCYVQDSLGNVKPFLSDSLKEFVKFLSFGWKTDQGYWHGTHLGGFYFHDPRTYRLTKIRDLKSGVNYIYEDSFHLLWISVWSGRVYCYNPAKDTLIDAFTGTISPSSRISGHVNQIYEDRKGRLWFATSTGLNRLERSTNTFVHFTETSGLPCDDIRGILEDDHGFLWLNTVKGISRFDPEALLFRNYDVSFGLEPPSDVYYGSGCKTRNGEMYLPGGNGFTRFHPDSIKDNPFVPPIVIASFKKFDKPYPFSDEIRLSYDENFISFEFVALSYISPERNQYAYKLEGLDRDWVYSGTRRYASYPGLEPGKYVFRVKGSNNDGVWNETGTSIAVIIAPPWWKTSWAYVLYSSVLLSVLFLTWKLQVKRIRVAHEYEMSRFESEKLREVDEMKSRFFANISHEFRTPLTLILGPVKQIIERTKEEQTRDDLRVVHKNANRLLGLVNQLLDISKLESGNMKLRTVPQNVIPLLKALVLSFTSYAERKRIELVFDSRDNEIIAYIDKDKIEKIITNILSNAFKFTPEGGRIEVAVVKDEHGVNVSVSDTGIGIPADRIPRIFDRFYQIDESQTRAQEGTGIGLSLTKELIELHKGKIEVESTEGKGTTFTVRIPLGKEHLKQEEICEPGKEEEGSFIPEEMVCHEGTRAGKLDIGAVAQTDLTAEQAGKPLLLIVEDNADVRSYIQKNVMGEYRILEAVDGEDGWNKSIEHMPDVIISDVMMPKMDGFMLCDKLKKDERTSHIPVILLTARASSRDKIEGLATGADDYIMKPFEPEEVNARIRNLIEQRKRIHEHFRKHGLFEIEEKKITPVDQKFLQNALAVITKHMSDASFGVEALADAMAVSRSLLLKKLEALVGESPNELIRRTRLNRAAQLIEGKSGNVSEIALEVGFSNPSYFAECFKKQFGLSPSQYHRSPA